MCKLHAVMWVHSEEYVEMGVKLSEARKIDPDALAHRFIIEAYNKFLDRVRSEVGLELAE